MHVIASAIVKDEINKNLENENEIIDSVTDFFSLFISLSLSCFLLFLYKVMTEMYFLEDHHETARTYLSSQVAL